MEHQEKNDSKTPAAQAAVGEMSGSNNEATPSPRNSSSQNTNHSSASSQPGVQAGDAAQNPNIADNLEVSLLMTSAVVGWQLYAMSRSMYDELPMFSAEEKKACFEAFAEKAISRADGNMVPFKPVHTIAILQSVVLPMWLAHVNAAAQKRERFAQEGKQSNTGEVTDYSTTIQPEDSTVNKVIREDSIADLPANTAGMPAKKLNRAGAVIGTAPVTFQLLCRWPRITPGQPPRTINYCFQHSRQVRA